MGRATLKGKGKGGGGGRVKGGGKTRDSHALPLHEALDEDLATQRREEAREKRRGAALGKKRKSREEGEEGGEGEEEQVLERGLTAKILRQARKQQQEIARELERESGLEATRQAFDMAAAVVAAAGATDPHLKSQPQPQPQAGPSSAERPARGPPGAPAEAWGSEDEDEEEGEGEEEGGHLPRGWGAGAKKAGAGTSRGTKAGAGAGAGKGEGEGEGEDGEGEEVPWQSLEGKTKEGGGAGEGDDTISVPGDLLDAAGHYDDELGVEVTEEDERAIALFLAPPSEAPLQRTLADVIREKISEHTKQEAEAASREASGIPALDPEMRSKVQAVYRGVGQLLSRYTAGQVPKAFKLIPALSNWEEVLQLTHPEGWTAPAMFAATRVFASNLNARMAQRFFRLVLLPRLRRDIRDHKRLHFALYHSLKKALYKPSAFFKGILLPICQSRTCSLREAVIIGSVLQKVSIPVLHSSVALMRIAEMPYAGTNSYFMKLFFDKKYALPYRVLDAVADHFGRFRDEPRVLPVIWHQSLLSFVQRYKEELTIEQKGALRALVAKKHHYLMSPEILRELNSSNRLRGQKLEPGAAPKAAGAGPKGAGEGAASGRGARAKRQKMDVDEMASLPQVHMGMEED